MQNRTATIAIILALALGFSISGWLYKAKPSLLYGVPDRVIFRAIDPCNTEVSSDAYAAAKSLGYASASYRGIRVGCESIDNARSGSYYIIYDTNRTVEDFCRRWQIK